MHKHYDIVIPFIVWLAIAVDSRTPFRRPLIERDSREIVVCFGRVKVFLTHWRAFRRYL